MTGDTMAAKQKSNATSTRRTYYICVEYLRVKQQFETANKDAMALIRTAIDSSELVLSGNLFAVELAVS